MPIGEYKIGDEVTYNDIIFYVIENSDTVTLLKKVENKDNNINSIDTKNDNNIINKVDVSNTLWNKSIFFCVRYIFSNNIYCCNCVNEKKDKYI